MTGTPAPDTKAPTAPSALTATAGRTQVTLSWTPEHIHLVRESGAERATDDHEALARSAGGPAGRS